MTKSAPEGPAEDDFAALAEEVARLAEGPGAPDPEREAAASRRRLSFIVAYARDPLGDPAFQDRAVVFGILSKEQAYQGGLEQRLASALKALPPPAAAFGLTPEDIAADPRFAAQEARREELTKSLAEAAAVSARIYRMMKGVVGKAGQRTGGTGPLVAAPAEDAPLDAVLDHIGDVLRARQGARDASASDAR